MARRTLNHYLFSLGRTNDGCVASVVKLLKNFRSHPEILKFPNEHFYQGELRPCGDKQVIDSYIGWPHLPNKRFPVIFHSVSGQDQREASSPSFFNISEVTQVKKYVQLLREDRRFRISKSLYRFISVRVILNVCDKYSEQRYWSHYPISSTVWPNS